MELKRCVWAWTKLSLALTAPRGIMEISACHSCKIRVEEKATSPTSELSGLEICPGVLGCPGILPSQSGWQGVKDTHCHFGDNSVRPSA